MLYAVRYPIFFIPSLAYVHVLKLIDDKGLKKEFRGRNPRSNYTDQATATCLRS
jgi:hypothetical protein